jgi:hypothetical protein
MSHINPLFTRTEEVQRTEYVDKTAEGSQRNHVTGMWAVIAVLAVALGMAAGYGYRATKNQSLEISQLTQGQAAIGPREDATDSKLSSMSTDWTGFTQRVSDLEGKIGGSLRQSKTYAKNLADELHRQMDAEMDARTTSLNARLSQVESEQKTQDAQLAQLQSQLQLQIQSAREDAGKGISAVQEQVSTTADNLNALSNSLQRQEVRFEVAKGQTTEVAPGISLNLGGTNVEHQRFHGYLWLLEDHRFVWLKDQNVNQSVRFYHKIGGAPYDLVVTDVSKDFVLGYLLIPKDQLSNLAATPAPTTASNSASN